MKKWLRQLIQKDIKERKKKTFTHKNNKIKIKK